MTVIPVRHMILVVVALLMVGCAHHWRPQDFADPYGFFSGIWHGSISLITISVNILSWLLSLIGMDLLADIQIIGRPNTGLFYYIGFAIGFLFLPIGGARNA